MRQLKCPKLVARQTVVARKEPAPRQAPAKKPDSSALPWTPRAGADQLRSIQAELKRIGCYGGEVDGQWGAASMAALGAAFAGSRRKSGPLVRLTERDAKGHIEVLKKLPAGRCAAPIGKPPVIAVPAPGTSSQTPGAAAGASLVGGGNAGSATRRRAEEEALSQGAQ